MTDLCFGKCCLRKASHKFDAENEINNLYHFYLHVYLFFKCLEIHFIELIKS